MGMHAAKLHSARLQRVLKVLSDGKPHTSLEITLEAGVVAVGTCISELRFRGAEITCEQVMKDDRRVWQYTMTKRPADG